MLLILKSVSSQTLFYSVSPFQMQGTNFIVAEGYIFSSVSLTFFTLYSFLRGGLNYKFHFVKIILKNTYVAITLSKKLS